MAIPTGLARCSSAPKSSSQLALAFRHTAGWSSKRTAPVITTGAVVHGDAGANDPVFGGHFTEHAEVVRFLDAPLACLEPYGSPTSIYSVGVGGAPSRPFLSVACPQRHTNTQRENNSDLPSMP
jgi:hypothetical protein